MFEGANPNSRKTLSKVALVDVYNNTLKRSLPKILSLETFRVDLEDNEI